MADNKTHEIECRPRFINALTDQAKRADAKTLVKVMQRATGEKPKMWEPSIVGFGRYHYRSNSGREGDSLAIAAEHQGWQLRACKLVATLWAARVRQTWSSRLSMRSTVAFADGSRFCYAGPITNRWVEGRQRASRGRSGSGRNCDQLYNRRPARKIPYRRPV